MQYSSNSNEIADELSIAAMTGDLDQVVRLAELSGNTVLFDAKGWNAMHWASQEGYLEIVNYLLSCGVPPDIETLVEKLTPLAQAVGCGHIHIAERLLESGASPTRAFPFLGNITSVDIAQKYSTEEMCSLLSKW